ncbi:MAG: terpene synthase [Roseiflexus sp.]|nr:terpene synthase [Roseiflexus sp.]MCS7288670.1 terpene synthase [Roseiflexus sp.]MDW8147942.1 terpene synthase [Roseiflexaceae bacterium]MDW8233786.1 terpene synthase [Roseiflexaceae bacterium]
MDQDYSAQLVYPFSGAISPYADAVDQATLAWAETFGLLTDTMRAKSRRLRYGLLAARAYPRANREMLQIAADWIAWLFFMDDQCDESGIGRDLPQMTALHERFLAVLNGALPTTQDWALTRALADIRRRLATRASNDWLRRFIEHVHLYFTANRWETINRQRGVTPNVATYCAARLFSGAVYACFDLIELADGIELPFYARRHAAVQQLERSANNIICWCNDVLSYPKEMRHGDVHNLVLVIQHEYQCSLPEAIDRALVMHAQEVLSFVTMRAQTPYFNADVNAALDRYFDGLQFWICANRDWSLTSIRYAARTPHRERDGGGALMKGLAQ